MSTGRGRLTRIERLPAALAPEVARAFDRITARQGGQDQILVDLNIAVRAAEIAPISRSGINRYAMRVLSGEAHRPAGQPENAGALASAIAVLVAGSARETALAALDLARTALSDKGKPA